ncbi:MAG: hypothetical protein HY332_25525 [Chloroflexi bacterium]|nr:hypothetical protein [Chloroflexota bacterium]
MPSTVSRLCVALLLLFQLPLPFGFSRSVPPAAYAAPNAPDAGGAQVPSLTPAVPPAAGTTLNETFQDNRNGWPIGTHQFFSEAGYNVRTESDDSTRGRSLAVPGLSPFKDLVVEVELRLESGSGSGWHGLIVRASPAGGYRLLINARGALVLDRVTGDGWDDLLPVRPHPAIKPAGSTNVVRLAVRDDVFNVFVNGQHVAHVRDEGDEQLREPGSVFVTMTGGQHLALRRLSVAAPSDADLQPPARPSMLFEDTFSDNRNRWPRLRTTPSASACASGAHRARDTG